MQLKLLVLRCKDIENTKIFYENLGLTFKKEKHGDGPKHYSTKIGTTTIELYPSKDNYKTDNTRLGFFLNVSDIHSFLEQFSIPIIPEYNFNGKNKVIVQDPDNRKVELETN